MAIKRIDTRADLQKLQAELGLRKDWHEPDEQGVSAKVEGKIFDNAGFWGEYFKKEQARQKPSVFSNLSEQYVTIYKDKKPVAEVNLATLFAMACGTVE